MKQKKISYILLLALLISACGAPAATPALDTASIQSTALAAAFTLIAETQAAIPTNTALPPTEIFTQTSLPTDTPAPSPTLDTLATPTVILLPTDLPAFTPQPATGNAACNQQLKSWQGLTSNFKIVNETNPKGKIVTFIVTVVTKMGECGSLNISGTSFSGPIGTYSAVAYVNINNSTNITPIGSFNINGGNWKIIVRNDRIVAKGGCYPNC